MDNIKLLFHSIFSERKVKDSKIRFFLLILSCLFTYGVYSLSNYVILRISTDISVEESLKVYSSFFDIFNIFIVLLAFFSTLIYSFELFFTDPELEFLFSMPLSDKTIFFNRIFKLIAYGSVVFIIFSIGILFSNYVSFDLPLYYIFVALINSVLFSANYVLLASLVLFVFLNIFGNAKTRKLLVSISVFFISIIIIAFRLIRPERFVNGKIESVTDYILSLRLPYENLIPVKILSNIIKASYLKDISGILINTGINVLICLALFYVVYNLYRKIYKNIWFTHLNHKVNYSFNIKKDSDVTDILIEKEKFLFLRNTFNIQQITLFIGVIIVFLSNLYFLRGMDSKYLDIVFFLNIATILLIVAAFVGRLFFGAFADNRKEIDFLRTLPVDDECIIKARFRMFWIPLLALAFLCNIFNVLIYSVDPILILLSFIIVAAGVRFLMQSGIYFSNYFISRRFSIFSAPVFGYMIKNFLVFFFVLIADMMLYMGFMHGKVNLFKYIGLTAVLIGILYLAGNLFYKNAIKNFINTRLTTGNKKISFMFLERFFKKHPIIRNILVIGGILIIIGTLNFKKFCYYAVINMYNFPEKIEAITPPKVNIGSKEYIEIIKHTETIRKLYKNLFPDRDFNALYKYRFFNDEKFKFSIKNPEKFEKISKYQFDKELINNIFFKKNYVLNINKLRYGDNILLKTSNFYFHLLYQSIKNKKYNLIYDFYDKALFYRNLEIFNVLVNNLIMDDYNLFKFNLFHDNLIDYFFYDIFSEFDVKKIDMLKIQNIHEKYWKAFPKNNQLFKNSKINHSKLFSKEGFMNSKGKIDFKVAKIMLNTIVNNLRFSKYSVNVPYSIKQIEDHKIQFKHTHPEDISEKTEKRFIHSDYWKDYYLLNEVYKKTQLELVYNIIYNLNNKEHVDDPYNPGQKIKYWEDDRYKYYYSVGVNKKDETNKNNKTPDMSYEEYYQTGDDIVLRLKKMK